MVPLEIPKFEALNPGVRLMSNAYPSQLLDALPTTDPRSELVFGNARDVQDEILEHFTDDSAGLNLDRVNTFLNKYAPMSEPYYVVSAEQMIASAKLLGFSDDVMIRDTLGFYSPLARMSMVARYRNREEKFGTIATEKVIIHEAAGHSASVHDEIEISGNTNQEILSSISMPRIGNRYNPFAPANHPARNANMEHEFAEEAYAEMIAQNYVWTVMPESVHTDGKKSFWVNFDGQKVLVPAPFLLCKEKEEPGKFRVESILPTLPAYAFHLLNTMDPEVIPLMNRGRRDVSAYDELDQRIEDLQPGLADILKGLRYTRHDFLLGLSEVIDLAIRSGKLPTHHSISDGSNRSAHAKATVIETIHSEQGIQTQDCTVIDTSDSAVNITSLKLGTS